jgi:hypothetical protein
VSDFHHPLSVVLYIRNHQRAAVAVGADSAADAGSVAVAGSVGAGGFVSDYAAVGAGGFVNGFLIFLPYLIILTKKFIMSNLVFFISNNILEWCLKSKLKVIMVMMVVLKIGIV